jgi:general secretion pathway protein G
VELLTVVLLVGVLLALALPLFDSHRDKTRARQAGVEMAQMSAVISNYWNDMRAFPNSLADVGMGGALDPWGRPYVYYNVDANGRGGARKDRALNPINSDYDLYSKGPDGVTKPQVSQRDSLDDVIRGRNGSFVGTAADF